MGAPDVAWRLIAQPEEWHRWAPHIRHGIGLGSPEVQEGARGFVLLAPLIPLPARIISVDPGHSWEWRIGPMAVRHAVASLGHGCEVALELRAVAPLELALHVAYGPLMALVVRNLARIAAHDASAVSPRSAAAT